MDTCREGTEPAHTCSLEWNQASRSLTEVLLFVASDKAPGHLFKDAANVFDYFIHGEETTHDKYAQAETCIVSTNENLPLCVVSEGIAI